MNYRQQGRSEYYEDRRRENYRAPQGRRRPGPARPRPKPGRRKMPVWAAVLISVGIVGFLFLVPAIIVGVNMASASSSEANINALTSDLQNLGAMAQQYYRKPAELGGGGNSFSGWEIPRAIAVTGNGTYSASVYDQLIMLEGTGNEPGEDDSHVKVQAAVTPVSVNVLVLNK